MPSQRDSQIPIAEDLIFWRTEGDNRQAWHGTLLDVRGLPEGRARTLDTDHLDRYPGFEDG